MATDQVPQLSDEELGLRPVSVPEGLDPETRAVFDGLMEDRRKLKGALEKSTHSAKTTAESLRTERFARLQAKHPALTPEHLDGVAPENWENHVNMWMGITSKPDAGVTPPATPAGTSAAGAPAIDPQTGQPVPETTNRVSMSPEAQAAMVRFFETVNGGGAAPAHQPMTFSDLDAKVKSGEVSKDQAARLIDEGKITDMPKISTKGGKLVIGG